MKSVIVLLISLTVLSTGAVKAQDIHLVPNETYVLVDKNDITDLRKQIEDLNQLKLVLIENNKPGLISRAAEATKNKVVDATTATWHYIVPAAQAAEDAASYAINKGIKEPYHWVFGN